MPSSNPIGSPFIELPSVESTNNYAMGLVHEGMAQHGMAVFAHDQTRGRGQRTKEWLSQPGRNIALSVILQPPPMSPNEIFLLSMAVAEATRIFISAHAGAAVKIKWPNDLYWCDRKAAGILIENVWQGSEWRFAIAGIGVNINQTEFGSLDSKAVSLLQITGQRMEPAALAHGLCSSLETQWQLLKLDPTAIARSYHEHLYKLNERIRLKKDNRVFEAIVKGVGMNGALIVEHAVEERFSVGEVEWLIS